MVNEDTTEQALLIEVTQLKIKSENKGNKIEN